MNKHRIYEKKHDIKTQNIQNFYDKRAKEIEKMENPYVSVLLGDQNPKHALNWNEFEKKYILKQLQIDKKSIVLDIGCGIGRWAEAIIPKCNYYLGVDFSNEMIKTAKNRCKFEDAKYDFINASFQEVVENFNEKLNCKFNRVIIAGVCMYINDKELEKCIDNLGYLLEEHCLMYFTETVAIKSRLTLDECPSEALKTTYDVIYRTPLEYNQYYEILMQEKFKILSQGYLPHLNNEQGFSETDRWYTIFER